MRSKKVKRKVGTKKKGGERINTINPNFKKKDVPNCENVISRIILI